MPFLFYTKPGLCDHILVRTFTEEDKKKPGDRGLLTKVPKNKGGFNA